MDHTSMSDLGVLADREERSNGHRFLEFPAMVSNEVSSVQELCSTTSADCIGHRRNRAQPSRHSKTRR